MGNDACKKCPYCCEKISNLATKCQYCGQFLIEEKITLPDELYKKLKEVLKESLQEQTSFHKEQVAEIGRNIEKTEDDLRRMYTDKLDGLITTDMWVDLKKHAEGKLYELKMKQKKYEQANIDYLEYGVQILDVCAFASKPSKEITPKMMAQILDKTAKKITVKNEKVKVQFSSPYNIIETLKKRLKTASLKSSSRMEWWARRDCLGRSRLTALRIFFSATLSPPKKTPSASARSRSNSTKLCFVEFLSLIADQ